MTEERADREHDWEAGWESHEIAQLRRMARLSLEEKLRWLEEADALAKRLARQSPRIRPRPKE